MDVIREHLMYKNTPLIICMAKIPPQEQYEVIRILLESKTEQVSFCTHDSTNAYIDTILKKLNVKFVHCWKEQLLPHLFDLHTGCRDYSQ
jgi:hypothetical protein